MTGTAQQIFPQYLEHIDAALENFCDCHWPCEYVKPGGGARCVNVRSGHVTKGHQLKNGKVLAVGGYVSSFSFEGYQETFRFDVYSQLNESLKELHSKVREGGEIEAQAAAAIHKDTVMMHFYKHADKHAQQANAASEADAGPFISQSTCFSCLVEPPEHALPCGHILCAPCIRAFGRTRARNVVEINECPIESLTKPRNHLWKVFLKPADAGTRILTLDGYVDDLVSPSARVEDTDWVFYRGGIRGIVQLEILRQIEQALGGKLAIQCFFDLIVGTR